MKHAINKINTGEDSHWISVEGSNGYTKSSATIEETDVTLLVASILSEFENTPDSSMATVKHMLTEWLSNMDESEIDEIGPEKVRDFIYEMF